MKELMEHIQSERRRLKEVRQALTSAVSQSSAKDDSYVPFYVAIGDYLEAAMDRLDTQDVRMGDMLRSRVSKADQEAQTALTELDERLAGNQAHLKRFLEARDCLKTKGSEAIKKFEAASRAYTDYITSNMGHHGGSTSLARQHFSEDDWVYMANISDEDIVRERDLFNVVFANVPDGLSVQAAS